MASNNGVAADLKESEPAMTWPDQASLRAVGFFASYGLSGASRTPPPNLDERLILDAARVAETNKLLRPFMEGLAAAGVTPPPAAEKALSAYRARAVRRNAGAVRTLHKVVPVLKAANIPFAVFKGPVQQLLVTGDMMDRPVSDIDMLVADRDFDRATQVIRQAEFDVLAECDAPWWRTYLGEHALVPRVPGLAVIDLHHRTQQPGCPSPNHPDWMLRDLVEVRMGDLQVPTLNPVSTALLAVISICKGLIHREESGAHALDLARMLSAATNERRAAIKAAALSQGLANSYELALRAADALLDVEEYSSRGFLDNKGDLLGLLLTPEDPGHNWPKRRDILWALTDGRSPPARIIRYGKEIAWAGLAELSLRKYLAQQAKQQSLDGKRPVVA